MFSKSDSKGEQAAEEQGLLRPSVDLAPPSYAVSKPTAGDSPVSTKPASPSSESGESPPIELSPSGNPLKDAAHRLQQAIEEYKAVHEQFSGPGASAQDKQTVREQEEAIIRKLKETGDRSNDIRVREYYHRTAELFMRAAPGKKKGILNDVGRGLVMLVAAPIALCAASIGAVGDILAGTGLLVKGIGKTMLVVATGGKSLKERAGIRVSAS
ncbi:hypothetical protein E1B28_001618 [Marasmius oreades]|uniref:Uncharacterized protein n=1 Tax=Marasmius oreades TaxID=181124 RepID=A0A9P8AFL0_9AGAR|nr:uncharacterized protein E1B28_001618 [Marasmius oreades]KAG7099807.1 hypothetical protein E1B28_001618 [Marasmius oreades]